MGKRWWIDGTRDPATGVRRFTESEDRKILQMRGTAAAWSQISYRLRDATRDEVVARHRFLTTRTPGPGKRLRRCLKCERDFPSEHAGNRICYECNKSIAGIAATARDAAEFT